jgi:hypothetical protein
MRETGVQDLFKKGAVAQSISSSFRILDRAHNNPSFEVSIFLQ